MKSIGIIGGGIGGVTAAAALHKLGIHATVYERAPELKEAGAGMMLWPNATRVLKSLGVLDNIVARSGPNTNFLVRSSSGKVLMNIALGEFDAPALCARRSDLLSALLSAVPREQIQLGREHVRIEQSKSKVRIHFADGEAAEHDAVIGADGIRSRVRAHLFGISDPVYRGYTVWRGVAACQGDAIQPGENSETWGHGSRFGILDIGNNRYTWYATANTRRPDQSPPKDIRELQTQLAHRFGTWHHPIPHLIEAAEFILENPACDLPPLRKWTSGRVTLLGDAAHPCTPNLGQGGGMAIEDAMVLAKCFASNRSTIAALNSYESLRRTRTSHIQQRSRLMGNIGQWENRVVVAGRRAVTRMLPAALFEHNLGELTRMRLSTTRLGVMLLAITGIAAAQNPDSIDTQRSTITIHVGKTGLLSAAAHEHWVNAPIASGTLRESPDPHVEFVVQTAKMTVKPDAAINAKDQATIQQHMEEMTLEVTKFPEISFRSSHVEKLGEGQWKVDGALSLHGVTRPISLTVKRTGDAYSTHTVLKQTDFGIKPINVGGVIKVKNELDLDFQIYPRKA